MNSKNANPKPQTQVLTTLWLMFLISTVMMSVVSQISQPSDADLPISGTVGYFYFGVGLVLFVLSHLIFRTVSGRPIAYPTYLPRFIIALAMADAITVFGFVSAVTFKADVFTYALFGLGFLSVLIKKPNTDLISVSVVK